MTDLVDRIRAEAAMAARPGQMAALEGIANEVEELEAKLDDVRMRALRHMSLGNHMRPQEVLEALDDSYQERLTRALDDMEEDR